MATVNTARRKHSPILIGIDLGTTNLKVVAYTPNGQPVARASAPTPLQHPAPNRAEHVADELWQAICKLIRAVVTQLQSSNRKPSNLGIAGIAAATVGESGVLLDAHNQPLGPVIAWYDNRTATQLDWWRTRSGLSAAEIYAITGLPLQHIFGVHKLLWLKQNQPALFAKAVRWLNLADWIAFKLSSAQATDFSLASRTMTLDLRTLRWSDPILRAAAIPSSLLAPLVHSGTAIGRVTDEAAAQTQLPSGTPVVVGGHDHICALLAIGISQRGEVMDSIGTSEGVVQVLDKPALHPSVGEAGYGNGAHVAPGLFYMLGGMYSGGACVDWAMRLLCPDAPHDYAGFVALAAQAPSGSDGVLFLPHLRVASPPNYDPQGRGAFVGLTADASRSTLARAVLEGMAFEAHQCLDVLAQMTGVPIVRHVVIGGGAKNSLLMEIKATLANRALHIVQAEEAAALGAALLAGLGTGVYANVAEIQQHVRHPQHLVQPQPELVALYQRRYEHSYRPLFAALREASRLARN